MKRNHIVIGLWAVFFVALIASEATAAKDVIINHSFDENSGQKDYGDKRGDVKSLSVTYRSDKNRVTYFEAGLYTPQYELALPGEGNVVKRAYEATVYDTATLSLYHGLATSKYEFFVGLDAHNGFILRGWQDLVKSVHGVRGLGTRTSPPTTSFSVTPAALARYDKPFGPVVTTAYGKVSYRDVYAGAGVFLKYGDKEWKPNLEGFPKQVRTSTSVYAGLTTEYKALEVRTKGVSTQPWRVQVHVGGSVKLGKRFFLEAQYTRPLRNEVRDPLFGYKPVPIFNINLGMRF